MQTRRQFVAGFTLVELLIVIAIIALLLAILMPALSKVRMQGQCVVCKTRLKDIGTMFNVYMQDHGNKMPPSYSSKVELNTGITDQIGKWYSRLAPYYKIKLTGLNSVYDFRLFRCPTQEKWNRLGDGSTDGGAAVIYGYNQWFIHQTKAERTDVGGDDASSWWRKPEAIKQPSDLPLVGDYSYDSYKIFPGSGGWHMLYTYPNQLAFKYGWATGKPLQQMYSLYNAYGPAPNHGTPNCNFLMADMHVDARNVCKAGQWPWLPDSQGRTNTGVAFHPTRKPGTCP